MTTKFKILSAISFISLAIVLTFVGVWALTDLDFSVGGNITYTAPVPEVEDASAYSYLTFSYNTSAQTASVTGFDSTAEGFDGNVIISDQVLYNDVVFDVISVGHNAFNSKGSFDSLKIGANIQTLSISCFGNTYWEKIFIDSPYVNQFPNYCSELFCYNTGYVYIKNTITVTHSGFSKVENDLDGYNKYYQAINDID